MSKVNDNSPQQANNSAQLKLVIVGQGAIGLLYYRFFSQAANCQLSLLCSKNSSSDITKLIYHQAYSATSQAQPQLTSKPSAQQLPIKLATADDIAKADVILLCVKSYQLSSAITDLAPLLSPSCLMILCHNGMGAFEALPALIKAQRCFLTMLTTHGSKKRKPSANGQHSNAQDSNGLSYEIEHTGLGRTDLGLLSGPLSQHQQEQLSQVFSQALGDFSWQADIIKQQWSKLAINCVINPITALENISNGEVLAAKYSKQIEAIIEEVVTVAAAENIALSAKSLTATVLEVAEKTATNSSSMRCDIGAHRPTEIDYINGYIHRLGLKHQISTPVNSHLWQQVKQQQ